MKPIVIVGAGGLAREVYQLIRQINQQQPEWDILGFIDVAQNERPVIDEKRILGDDEYVFSELPDVHVAIGLGFPAMRRKIYCQYKSYPTLSFPNLIHPGAIVDKEHMVMGEGNIICALSWISTSVTMGHANLINAHCIVAHDTTLGDFCVLNPGANLSGGVHVENDCLVGANAAVYQGVRLEQQTILGFGSTLTRNSKRASTYVGNPAKKLF